MENIINPAFNFLQLIDFYSASSFRQTLFEILIFIIIIFIIKTIINECKSLMRDLKMSGDAENWPKIDGVITKSIVDITGGGEDASWYNDINYSYDVNGKI
jgi:hypothetical protein